MDTEVRTGATAPSNAPLDPTKAPSWTWYIWPAVFSWIGAYFTWQYAKKRGYEIGVKIVATTVIVGFTSMMLIFMMDLFFLNRLSHFASSPNNSGSSSSTLPGGEGTTLPASRGSGNSDTTVTTAPATTCSATPPDSMTEAAQIIESIICARGEKLNKPDVLLLGQAFDGESFHYEVIVNGEYVPRTGTLTVADGAWHLTYKDGY